MPSYLVSAKEAFVPTELYQAPIEALGETLRVKQQQYDQAFSQISQSINSMESLKIDDETGEVSGLKQKYLADASNKLKNIASVDLSIPQNVSEANKIFQPFYNDPVLMANAGRTAFNDQQLKDLDNRQYSKDEAVRDTYHPALREYLNNDRKKIRKAGLDLKAYNQFEYRKAIPFVNQQKFLSEAAKAEGLKVVHTQENGPSLVEIEGGAPSLKNYQAWAASKLNDPVFNEQYMILGTVQQERKLNQLRQNPMYANYTDDQLKAIHAQNVVTELENSFTNREKSINTRQEAINTELNSLVYVEKPTTSVQANINKRMLALEAELNANKDVLTDLNTERAKFTDKNKAETLEMLQVNPNAYYASLARNQDINNFAAGRAAGTEQVKISKNDNFWLQDTSKLNWYKAETDNANKQTEFQMRRDGTYGTGGGDGDGSGGSENGSTSPGGINIVSQGATSAGTTNVQANQVYTNMLATEKAVHNNAIWDVNEGLFGIVSKLGISREKMVSASTGYQNKVEKKNWTPEQKADAADIERALTKETGISITGPESFKQALYKMVEKNLLDVKEGKAELTPEIIKYMTSMTTAQTSAKKRYAYEQERKRLVTENVVGNKEFASLVVTRADGTKDMVSKEDIAEQFSHMAYLDEKTNTYKRLTPAMSEEMADKYMSGTGELQLLKNRTSYAASPNGVPMKQLDITRPYIEVGGKEVNLMSNASSVLTNIVQRFGKPNTFKEKLEKALDSVVPNYSYFQGQTGKMGPVNGLPFDTREKVMNEAPVRILQELAVPEAAEIFLLDPATNEKTPVDSEQLAAIKNAIGSGEKAMQSAFGTLIHEPFGAKNGRFRIPIQNTQKDKNLPDLGLDFANNKQIVFEVNNISTLGPTLKQLRVGQQFYIYNDLREGKPVKSPEIMDGIASFKIIPNRSDSQATSAVTEFTFPLGDGKFKTVTSPSFPITGDGAVDPDTRVRMTYEELFRQLKQVGGSIPQAQGLSGSAFLNR